MLAERLRRLRQERKLKQVEVAEAVGLSLHGYQDLEREVIPRGGVLLNLAEFYDVSIDWLMGRCLLYTSDAGESGRPRDGRMRWNAAAPAAQRQGSISRPDTAQRRTKRRMKPVTGKENIRCC